VQGISGLRTVDYSAMSVEYANTINKQLLSMQSKYGTIPLQEIKPFEDRLGMRGFMSYNVSDVPSLEYNASRMSQTVEELNARLLVQHTAGKIVPKTLPEIVTHEFGHGLQYKGSTVDEFWDLFAQWDILKTQQKWAIGISDYAYKSGAEAMAEAFVKINNGQVVNESVREAVKKYMGV